MKKTKITLACCFTSLFLAASAQAQITWTGNADSNFFNPFNWSGNSGPEAGVLFEDDELIIENVPGTIFAPGNLLLASGLKLTIINSNVNFRPQPELDPPAVYSIQGDLVSEADTEIILINSTLTVQSLSVDVVLTADSTSTLNIGADRNSINGDGSAANSTKVILGDGAVINFLNGTNGNQSATVGQRIVREETGTTFADDFSNPPLEEFILTPDDITPFTSAVGAFSIATLAPEPPPAPPINPDTMVGVALVNDSPFFLRTRRTATDWQYDVDFGDSIFFGWPGILGYALADINGDGLDDKIIWQNQGSQIQLIGAYTFNGSFMNTDFMNAGDIDAFWWDNVNMKPCFGDLDGDGVDDSMVTVSATEENLEAVSYIAGVEADAIYWGAWLSNGVAGFSSPGAGSAFSGWSPFGQPSLGDQPFLGDFNGDGVVDRAIFRTSTNQVFIVPGNPAGGWAFDIIGPISLGITGAKVTASDINGDGFDDLVVLLDPGFYNAGFQELYGYLNDKNNFASLTGAPLADNGLPVPDYVDVFGNDVTMLFGNIGPIDDFSQVKITSVTGGGPDENIAIEFYAPYEGFYTTEVSLTMEPGSWSGVGPIYNVQVPPFEGSQLITDEMLDFVFPGTDPRPKVFVRVRYTKNDPAPPPQ